MSDERLQNLLGALAVAIADNMNASSQELIEFKGEAASALVQIGTVSNLTISKLSKPLSLSHSATVRVVSKLVSKGLVSKNSNDDAREVALRLTDRGVALMEKILASKNAAIKAIISPFSRDERKTLEAFLCRMLKQTPKSDDDTLRICRMCDERVCPQDTCPVTV
jgi:MarR family transcriptional regulator, negative regulator of the multidrug operon emrRAB